MNQFHLKELAELGSIIEAGVSHPDARIVCEDGAGKRRFPVHALTLVSSA